MKRKSLIGVIGAAALTLVLAACVYEEGAAGGDTVVDVPVVTEPAVEVPAARFIPGTFAGYSDNSYSQIGGRATLTPTRLELEVVVDANSILEINIIAHGESNNWLNQPTGGGGNAWPVVEGILASQGTAGVDVVARATYTSNALIEAVNMALAAAER